MTIPTLLPPDSELLRLQTEFTQHLRNPEVHSIPEGLDERRMGIYSELIFNNVSSLMMEFFPVIYRMLSEDTWQALIREFFVTHRAETPYFPKLAEEFLGFLFQRGSGNDLPEWLLPLAHYEWLELYLYISESELPEQPLTEEQLTTETIYLSDLAVPAGYEFPVHEIQPDWQEQRTPAYLLVFRDSNDSVRFFEVQPLAVQLLQAAQEETGIKVIPWLKEKALEYGQTDEDTFVNFGLELVRQFNQEKLFTC